MIVGTPAASRFADLVAMVIADEGGFVDHPKDPGAATNMGITLATLARWRGTKTTAQDVQDLSVKEARQIYMTYFWNPIRGDDLLPGLDYMVFDFAVNSGPPRAARLLQTVVQVEIDGAIGPVTLAGMHRAAPVLTVKLYHDAKMEFYKRIKHPKTAEPLWNSFGKGWTNRAMRVRGHAYGMIGYRPEIGE